MYHNPTSPQAPYEDMNNNPTVVRPDSQIVDISIPPLPNGWTTACDPNDGRIFYWNPTTQEKSLVHPSMLQTKKNKSSWIPWSTTSSNQNNNDNSTRSFWPTATQKQRTTDPTVPVVGTDGNGTPPPENPMYARFKPDNHECYSITALVLCIPIGLFACYHSYQVNRCWRKGNYMDAYQHSKQVPKYAWAGVVVGALFWFYILFIREQSRIIDWREWHLFD